MASHKDIIEFNCHYKLKLLTFYPNLINYSAAEVDTEYHLDLIAKLFSTKHKKLRKK